MASHLHGRLALIAALVAGSTSCSAELDRRPFEALDAGRALDGREGLELYAPAAREAVLKGLEEQARYWGRGPEGTAELEELLAGHDASTEAGRAALHAALSAFVGRHAVMTETEMRPGLHELVVDGDAARAYHIGHNPGGEFREEVRFVRLDGRWFMTVPDR